MQQRPARHKLVPAKFSTMWKRYEVYCSFDIFIEILAKDWTVRSEVLIVLMPTEVISAPGRTALTLIILIS